MNYKLGLIIMVLLVALSSTANADIWVSNSSIVNGLPDVGWRATPTIYDDNGIWKLINGQSNFGFDWNDTSWNSNSSIVNGLSDVVTATTIFNDNGNRKLIGGTWDGYVIGFDWNNTEWVSNSSIVNGLPSSDGGSYPYQSDPEVFFMDNKFNIIIGYYRGYVVGFDWDGASWNSNSSIVSGLQTSPVQDGLDYYCTVFNDSGTWKLISSKYDGIFDGYQWSGSTWNSNSSIVNGLPDVGTRVDLSIFNDNGIWKLISGENCGTFDGFHWNENPSTIPTSFTNLGNNLIDHTPTITWTEGTDADGDTVSTYVYVGTTSTPTTIEGSTAGETIDLGTNITLTDGNTYYYRLRSYDGHFYSSYTTADEFRMNSLPSISNVTLTPVPTLDTDDLTAHNDTATDAEGDSITLYYRWYKDNVLQPTLNDKVTILASNLTTDDVWKVGIIPNDGYENGTEVQSSTTTIGSSNVAPTMTGITTNVSSIKYNKTLMVSTLNASDVNGDNYIFYVGSSSGLSDICTSSSTPSGTEANCSFVMNHTSGSYTLYGRLTDGNDTSIERSIVYSVDTTPPVLISSSVSPTSFTNDESTTISASVTVADGTVDWVKVKIRDNAFISTNYTMSLVNSTYKYTYSPAAAGNYLITHFYASDDSGNIMSQSAIHAFEVVTGGTGGGTGGGAPPANVTIVGDLTLTPDRRDTYFFYTAISGEQKGVYQFVANRNINVCSVAPNSDATCEIVDGYIVEVTLTVDENVKAYDGVLTVADENNYVATSSLVVRIVKLWGALPIGTWEVGGLASLLDLFFETTETTLVGIRTWFVALILGIFGFAFYKVYSL